MALQRRLQVLNCSTEEDRMNTALKVAFATSDMRHVDQHFGAAESFAIYAVDREQGLLLEVAQFGKLNMDGNEDKLSTKIASLDGCIAVYSQAVGASAISQLKATGIQPIKVSPGAMISELLESLQEELREGPSTWLARAMEQHQPRDPSRFTDMEAEGWEE